MNKCGRILSLWMFLIWVIIGVAVVSGVLMFYSQGFDVRGREAVLLNGKIAECLDKDLENFDLEKCGVNELALEENYFLKINIDGDVFSYGDESLEKDCEIKSGLIRAQNFPVCYSQELVIGDKQVEILTASNEEGGKNE